MYLKVAQCGLEFKSWLTQTVRLNTQTTSRHSRLPFINRSMRRGCSHGLCADLRRYRPKKGTARRCWATLLTRCLQLDGCTLPGFNGLLRCSQKRLLQMDRWLQPGQPFTAHRWITGGVAVSFVCCPTPSSHVVITRSQAGEILLQRLSSAVRVGLSGELLIKWNDKYALRT